jgi:outer membrane receptor protein involved in Fe transport
MKLQRMGSMLVVLASGLAVSGTAIAQATLEEVMVTARKREESLQDVPISITAVAGDRIAAEGIQRMEMLAPTVPNFTFAEAVSGSDQMFIRGVGSGVNVGFEMAVGQVIDGFFFGRSRFGRAAFLDIERVEVLKGPQGALIGKNTSAGAINITTRKPTDEFEGYISPLYEFEADEGFSIEGALSGPITETLKARVAARYDDRDGWVENKDTGEDDQAVEDVSLRGTLVWTPTDSFDATLQYAYGDYDRDGRTRQASTCDPSFLGFLAMTGNTEDCKANQVRYTEITRLGQTGGFENFTTEYDFIGLTLNLQMGTHTLTSLMGYADAEWTDNFESDLSSAEQVGAFLTSEETQKSLEVRVTNEAGGPFDYIIGLYYQDAEIESNFDLHLCIPFYPVCNPMAPPSGTRVILTDQDGDTIAGFGQLTWNINEQWSATVGARSTHEDKDGRSEQFAAFLYTKDRRPPGGAAGLGNEHNVTGKVDEDNFSPSFELQWRPTDDMMFYGSVRRGFKGGGFDHQLNASQEAAERGFQFDEEEVTAFEIGGKMTLLEGSAQLNWAVFRSEFDDLQISALQPDVSFQVGNAASAITQGVEVDGKWQATENFRLSAAVAYLDAEYDDFPDAPCNGEQVRSMDPACTLVTPTTGVQDLSGAPLQYAPDWNFVIDGEYVWPLAGDLELVAFARAYYTDDMFLATDLDPNVTQDDYWKIDARLSLSHLTQNWEIAVIGRNLTDEITANFGNDGNGAAGASYFKMIEPPLSIALQGTWRFGAQ